MDRRRCAHCGEVIGVYEPITLVLTDGGTRRGSQITLDSHLQLPGGAIFHEACYDAGLAEPKNDS